LDTAARFARFEALVQVYPTRSAVHLALGAGLIVLVGVVVREAALLAWGGGLMLAVALARAAALVSVARIRGAGFEMLWSSDRRVVSVPRGTEVIIKAEVRNRDTRAARYVHLRPVASSSLDVQVEPTTGEVPAGGRLDVDVKVRTPRVGRHAVHGLSLEVQGSPGLFEVPLTFANPYGIEVLPRAFAPMLTSARGGRSRRGADLGVPGPRAGDGTELRELREHQPGDPFKRIAWRPSAKRGQLLVREFEREERDVVWVVLDASVELWAGPPGSAPLDFGIDELASVARQHLVRGDRVGLAVVGARVRALLEPDRGARHAQHLALGLVLGAATYDSDRSDLEERDVAVRVLEHLRPLDAKLGDVKRHDLDRLAFRAEVAISRAPFVAPLPDAPSQRERVLRHYLASFGIDSPGRSDPERSRTDEALARMLDRIAQRKPHPSLVHIWSPAPDAQRPDLMRAVVRLRREGAHVRWITAHQEESVQVGDSVAAHVVADAVVLRSRAARERGERLLRRMGIRVERLRKGFLSSGQIDAALTAGDSGATSVRRLASTLSGASPKARG
jgi:uncharacterized protein (DUF58 family)